MPLPRVKKATLTAFEMHPQACLQDDFAWRVNLQAHMILFPPFLIQGEKGVRCASGTRIAPFYAPLRSALLVVCHWQTAPEPAGENGAKPRGSIIKAQPFLPRRAAPAGNPRDSWHL